METENSVVKESVVQNDTKKVNKNTYKVVAVKEGFVVAKNSNNDLISVECPDGTYVFGDTVEI